MTTREREALRKGFRRIYLTRGLKYAIFIYKHIELRDLAQPVVFSTEYYLYLLMTIKPKNELSPKHLQALELIRTRNHTYRDIAKIIGWSEDYLQKLIAGDTAIGGSSAVLFSQAVKEMDAEQAKRIKELTKNTKEGILLKFEEFTLEYKNKPADPKVRREMVSIMNAIGKVTPNVEIGSFTYMKGLSAEDLFNEFRRLKDSAIDRRGIQGLDPGRTGTLPESEEPGSPS